MVSVGLTRQFKFMELRRFGNFADWVRGSVFILETACQENNPLRLALSGGSTPAPIYEAFASDASLPDNFHLKLFQVDERFVPPEHPDSNHWFLNEHLLEPLKKKFFGNKNILDSYFFSTDVPIEQSLRLYEKEIKKDVEAGAAFFDLAVLGLGSDGHIASLFPGSPALQDSACLAAHTTTDLFAVRDRLTLTFPAIMSSKKILLLLRGKEKEKILHDLIRSQKSVAELPAKKLLEHQGLIIHYCGV
jgi:6-phosphogluconolactonase